MIEKNNFYESPRIKTIELENESVLCQSSSGVSNETVTTEDFTIEEF